MDWISNLATSIAVFRLVLICCGMWIQLKLISRPGIVQDGQRRCFATAGIIYLLGLMPQSLLLLLVSSDLVNVMLDSGYLCSAQKFVCMVAVALHNIIFLNWIFSYIRSLDTSDIKCFLSFFKRKLFFYCMVSYTIVFMFYRRYLTNDEDTKTFYADLATRIDNSSFSSWAISSSERPLQIVRLQLLLCESSLDKGDVLSYMIVSYAFLILPVLLLCFIWKYKVSRKQVSENQLDEIQEGEQSYAWWEKEDNIQRLLSTSITIWFYLIQPIIFYFHPEHFVDFGVHLLLTICVFIPWTLSEKDYNSGQSWV